MLAKGSLRFILVPLILGLFFHLLIHLVIGLFFYGFSVYQIWFFRDPNREIIKNRDLFYSPADGTVISVKEIKNENSLKIAVRMSPFDVHLNRAPTDGLITQISRTPGKHLSVYFGDVEKKNERNLIVLENEFVTCEILQITGIFARRIECWVDVSQQVKQGDKIGIIRFGSQTNLVIKTLGDTNAIKPIIKEGDKVKAGITILATLE